MAGGNRPVNQKLVKQLADDIRTGKWKLPGMDITPDGIGRARMEQITSAYRPGVTGNEPEVAGEPENVCGCGETSIARCAQLRCELGPNPLPSGVSGDSRVRYAIRSLTNGNYVKQSEAPDSGKLDLDWGPLGEETRRFTSPSGAVRFAEAQGIGPYEVDPVTD